MLYKKKKNQNPTHSNTCVPHVSTKKGLFQGDGQQAGADGQEENVPAGALKDRWVAMP